MLWRNIVVGPPKIVLSVIASLYSLLHSSNRFSRFPLLSKDNTSLEAVTLIEENDNEVFKLLN